MIKRAFTITVVHVLGFPFFCVGFVCNFMYKSVRIGFYYCECLDQWLSGKPREE